MSSVDNFKLTRDDLLNILNEMSIAFPRNTKVKTNRLRHRLERALDAAQRYSVLFGDEIGTVNPLEYPPWDEQKDVTEALHRKCWGDIFRESECLHGAFAKTCGVIISLGKYLKEGAHEVVLTDEKSTGIVVRVSPF